MTSAIFEESERFRVALTSRARRKRRSRLNADRGSTLWAPRAIGWWIGTLFAVGAKQFRAEREKVTEASKETIGNIIDQLSAIEKRLERRSTLEDSTDEIKADLAELKGIRAEVQSLKESVDAKKREE